MRSNENPGGVIYSLHPCTLLLLVQAEGGGRRDDVLQACEEVLTVKYRGVLHDESDDTTRDTGCPGVG